MDESDIDNIVEGIAGQNNQSVLKNDDYDSPVIYVEGDDGYYKLTVKAITKKEFLEVDGTIDPDADEEEDENEAHDRAS